VDAGAITAFTDYRLEGAGNFTVTNASSTNTFTVAVDNVGNATSIANKLGQSTANLTIEGTKFDAGTLSLDGLTTLNLASTKGGAAAGANTVNFNAGTPVDNLTILVTGNQGLTIGSPTVTKTGVTVDATKFTASLTATGTNKVDILTGSAQNDSLTGNGGADTLTGGGGADTFILNQAAAGNTVSVTDFTVDQNDVFALSNAAYAGAPAAGSKLTLSAVSGAPNAATTILVDTQANINAASIANIRFAYGSDTKTLWYDADGNFTAGSVAIATSTLAITPTASSFSIV
jgi:Ca2+-binding RTX toxin-like protein